MKKVLLTLVFSCIAAISAYAQTPVLPAAEPVPSVKSGFKPFEHMELSLTGGTSGIGLELATSLGDYVKLRSGLSYVPAIKVPMTFGIQVGDDPTKSQSRFNNMSKMLSGFTGREVDSEIDMIGEPTFWNWNVLFNIYPLKNNKHWHVTAGFYLGPSHIAKAYNTTEDMPSLMAVGIYNNIYNKVHADVDIYAPENEDAYWDLYDVKFIDLSVLGEEYADMFGGDIQMNLKIWEKFHEFGRMGVHVGDFVRDMEYMNADGKVISVKKGDPYRMEPDANSMVKANMVVNRFKPYLGIGYEGRLLKNDDRYKIAIECGAMFWGGAPKVTTHEGVDLNHDVENIDGKVGRYVDAINHLKVFPILNLRLTRTLF